MSNQTLPPVIILGGGQNALSIARSLGSTGVRVYAIGAPESVVRYSRFAQWIDLPYDAGRVKQIWSAYLLGADSEPLRGAVLLAAEDEALELVATERTQLAEKFRLDLSNPEAQLCMLDKLSTSLAARAAGVPTPKFWVAASRDEVARIESELVFPLVVKPLLSHKFKKKFSGTFLIAHNLPQLLEFVDQVQACGVPSYLVELIPGPDSNLCSYYTYLDENGENLFDYTKRVIRRYPMNMGGSTYHITDEVADAKELGLALFRQVGLRGVANVEFKLDERDGRLKLIECNARFTAADCLLVASGLNLSLFVYNRILGREQEAPKEFRKGLRLWKPVGDILSFRELHRKGILSFGDWMRSILHPQILPVFRWYDPLPSIVDNGRLARHVMGRLWSKISLPPRPSAGSDPLSPGKNVAAPLQGAGKLRMKSMKSKTGILKT